MPLRHFLPFAVSDMDALVGVLVLISESDSNVVVQLAFVTARSQDEFSSSKHRYNGPPPATRLER